MSANNRTPLRAPEVGRMAEIEEAIRQAQPELAMLSSRLDAAQDHFPLRCRGTSTSRISTW